MGGCRRAKDLWVFRSAVLNRNRLSRCPYFLQGIASQYRNLLPLKECFGTLYGRFPFSGEAFCAALRIKEEFFMSKNTEPKEPWQEKSGREEPWAEGKKEKKPGTKKEKKMKKQEAAPKEPAVKAPLAPGLYATPFSKAYWKDACKELTKVRMLAVAAILIAVRVALKSLAIPIAPPTLMINLGFFVNALGAMIFGPVVASLSAAISDTLGALISNPTGSPYFFPFIFVEIAGSLIFALFLYRAPLTGLRITMSRFCVSFFVNIVIQTPIMLMYQTMILGNSYKVFDLPRICKNLVLFPFESLLLILFLGLMVPITYKMKLTYDPPKKLKITKKAVLAVVILFVVGSCSTAGFAWYDYNTRNHAKEFESDERAAFNEKLENYLKVDDDTLVLVYKINRTAFQDEENVTFNVYSINPESGTDHAVLRTLKNKTATGDKYKDVLTCTATGSAVLSREDESLISITTEPIEP